MAEKKLRRPDRPADHPDNVDVPEIMRGKVTPQEYVEGIRVTPSGWKYMNMPDDPLDPETMTPEERRKEGLRRAAEYKIRQRRAFEKARYWWRPKAPKAGEFRLCKTRYFAKAYHVEELRQYDRWTEKEIEEEEFDEEGYPTGVVTTRALEDDDVVYINENYAVSRLPAPIGKHWKTGELQNVIFDNVDREWVDFCTKRLDFVLPDDIRQLEAEGLVKDEKERELERADRFFFLKDDPHWPRVLEKWHLTEADAHDLARDMDFVDAA